MPVGGNENVGRLYITVDNATAVQNGQNIAKLTKCGDYRFFIGQRSYVSFALDIFLNNYRFAVFIFGEFDFGEIR